MHMLFKIEAGVAKHIKLTEGGWGVYTTPILSTISEGDKNFIMNNLTTKTSPRLMCGRTGDKYSCPQFMHSVAGLCIDKPKAVFSIKYVEIDLLDLMMHVLEEWDVAVQQWDGMDKDSGFVHIDPTFHY